MRDDLGIEDGRAAAVAGPALLVALLVLTGCAERVSDTGYVGTWERMNASVPSTISIREEGDGHVFRWSLADGPRRVECDREGRCEEFFQRNKIYRYEFTMRPGESQGELLVERVGTPIQEGLTPLTLVDRLELQPGGLELWSRTIEINGQPTAENRVYKYRKISDQPF